MSNFFADFIGDPLQAPCLPRRSVDSYLQSVGFVFGSSRLDKSRTLAELQSIVDFSELQHDVELREVYRRVQALDHAIFPSAIPVAEIQMHSRHFRIYQQDVIHRW